MLKVEELPDIVLRVAALYSVKHLSVQGEVGNLAWPEKVRRGDERWDGIGVGPPRLDRRLHADVGDDVVGGRGIAGIATYEHPTTFAWANREATDGVLVL